MKLTKLIRLAGLTTGLAALPGIAQTYTVLHHFGSAEMGCHPYGGLVQGPDGTLYGTTSEGGAFNYGTVFKLNSNGSGYTVLHSLGGSDGAGPQATLVLAGNTLYGTTFCETPGKLGGTLFKLNVDGSNFTVLKQYAEYGDNTGGAVPTGGLLLSGATLYGTTEYSQVQGGGASGYGTVFKLNTDGSGYTLLRTFSLTDGNEPAAALLLDGVTLYGTTSGGGSFPGYNCGTVFKVNTDGTAFTLLQSFTITNGDGAFGSLTLSGTTLYGTTLMGGDAPGGGLGNGTVFKINTDGSSFSLLKTLSGNDGANPYAGLVLAGEALYGTTPYTTVVDPIPPTGYGTVFTINTDGSGFTVLKTFSGTDGAHPCAGLLFADGTLYGTTVSGGISNNGVVFALAVAPPAIDTSPASQTAECGSCVGFSVRAHGCLPLTYQWCFNETNFLSTTTNSVLQLNNVQPSHAGAYRVVVANCIGAVTSSPAMLDVIAPVERRPVPGVRLTGASGTLLNVDYASTLSSVPGWSTIGSLNLTSTSQFYFDLTAPLPPRRFYRVWQTGTPGVRPSLDLHLVPAITLTGTVGRSVRLDYINQFGPTDAWVTLNTVPLTNTSQLYFDVSAPGQPQRLYRLIQVP